MLPKFFSNSDFLEFSVCHQLLTDVPENVPLVSWSLTNAQFCKTLQMLLVTSEITQA